MKDFLVKIVSAIVENPDQIDIVSAESNGAILYTILVPETEVGKVIGKEGKVITAIRCLARLKALKNKLPHSKLARYPAKAGKFDSLLPSPAEPDTASRNQEKVLVKVEGLKS